MRTYIEQRLQVKGIRPTAVRNLVLNCILQQKSAISLGELEKALAPVDRTTVYRSLKTFQEHCLVHAIQDGTGASKYALCDEDCTDSPQHNLHIHFYCKRCHHTFCLPKTSIPVIKLPNGYYGQEMSLLMKGICLKCSS